MAAKMAAKGLTFNLDELESHLIPHCMGNCVHASSVNMFKNKIDKYLAKAGYT